MNLKVRIWMGMMSALLLSAACPNLSLYGQDFPSNRSLLPEGTVALFEVVDAPRLEERWHDTFLGKLSEDPELQPFFESQKDAIKERMSNAGFAVNFTFNDLRDIASGEVALAWLQLGTNNGICLLVDTRGREQQTDQVLKRIDEDLRQQRQALVKQEEYKDQKISVYTLKRKLGQINVERFCYSIVGGRLIGSDRPEVVKLMIDTLDGSGTFSEGKDVIAVETQIKATEETDIRWFVRPLGYARVLEDRGGGLKKQQLDTIKLLQQQGFDAILSAGGALQLDLDKFDVSHRGYIYAPATTNEPSKYKLAARMLQFPNRDELDPPEWIIPTAASYLDVNWKMEEAFWAAETLVNQAVGDEIFRRVIDGIKIDKDGPQIDIADDIVANFRERLILVTDNTMPVSTKSERLLVGVALKGVDKVKAAIDKAMENDPNASEFKYPHHDWIWQVTQPEAIEDEIELEGFEDFDDFDDGDGQASKPPLLNQWAITVYDGYLMFSSHAQMLVETIDYHRSLQANPSTEVLKDTKDFKRMREAITSEEGASRALWRVLRTQLAFRAKYELFKRGELKDSDSVLAAIIRRILDDSKPIQDNDIEIDVSKLPGFNVIEQHLEPAGVMLKTQPEGWSLRGLMLKQTPNP